MTAGRDFDNKTLDLRRRRALDRDGAVFSPHWERWAAQEDVVLASVRERADLVVDTGCQR